MKRFAVALFGAGIIAAAAGNAVADDLDSLRKKRDFKPTRIVEGERKSFEEFQNLGGDTSKGAFAPYFQWPAGYAKKLKVCFYGGSDEVRQVIKELASEWEQPDNSLRFDWGKNGFRDCEKSTKKHRIHIRVGFAEPGYWSALGQDSIQRDLTMPSMNFEGFDKLSAEEIRTRNGGYDAGTVRHEFGHAIGLTHEHQSPKATCEADFDWDKIYTEFGGPPNNWSKQTIDFNMRRETDPDIISTKFDPKSVMKYWYPAEIFKNGKDSTCYTEGDNNELSPLDRKAVAFMYPVTASEAAARAEERKSALAALVAQAEEEGASKSVGPDLVSRFFSEPEPDNEDD